MTQEQVNRYEELRTAKRELETLLDATQDENFEGFAAVINSMIPSTVLPNGKVHRYATSKYIVEQMTMFLKTELSNVNHLIEQI